jgi:hypothetical protein
MMAFIHKKFHLEFNFTITYSIYNESKNKNKRDKELFESTKRIGRTPGYDRFLAMTMSGNLANLLVMLV